METIKEVWVQSDKIKQGEKIHDQKVDGRSVDDVCTAGVEEGKIVHTEL